MKENYQEFLSKSLDLKKIRDKKSKEIAKETLYKKSKKKIETTMIGALDAIEKNFGFLWNFGENTDLSPEQAKLKDIYDQVRSHILDKGNIQIRNLELDFSNFEISKKKQIINIPVKPNPNVNSGE